MIVFRIYGGETVVNTKCNKKNPSTVINGEISNNWDNTYFVLLICG